MDNPTMMKMMTGDWNREETKQYAYWQLNLSICHYIECYGKDETIKFLGSAIEKVKTEWRVE